MAEIIIKFPYKKINIPGNCSHCGNYTVKQSIEITRPSLNNRSTNREWDAIVNKPMRVNLFLNLCEECFKKLKNKKRKAIFFSIIFFISMIIGLWYFILPVIQNISENQSGQAAGLLFVILSMISLFLIFFMIGFPSVITNRFIGMQILSYNPRKITIRFYNEVLANKFFDLNNITEEHIIKRKK
ncbi:hypothetical protein HY745_14895 [Candidatus Desantisbacteria bacterium]|nr:hypothetical protein [Candidatus Desantisbacteria bacterium]